MARRKRLTRNAYKRKIILFGLLSFLSNGLISTGFATLMMSSSAQSDSSGNVNVGLVASANVEFYSIELYKDEEYYDSSTYTYGTRVVKVTDLESNLEGFYFSFEPNLFDTTGRVHYGESEIGSESLKMYIHGTVGPLDVLSDVTISLKLQDSIKKAVEAGYIELPECYEKPKVLTLGNGLELVQGETQILEFDYVVEFKWGSAFNYMNPGIYFDEDESGISASIDDVQKDLLFLRAYVYGYSVQLNKIYKDLREGTITETEFKTTVDALQHDENISAPKFTLTIVGNIK